MSYGKAPWNRLSDFLEDYPSSAHHVDSIVRLIQEEYSVLPVPKIIFPGDGWDIGMPIYVHKTHLIDEEESFRVALENVIKTGRSPDSSEQTFLHHILDCPFLGWSATTPAHYDDDWVHYLRHQFTLPGLIPILDDMTWPEEIAVLPAGYGIASPLDLLLADSTNFYFFEYDGGLLWKAGTTLKEVYLGLKRKAWWSNSDEIWEEVEDNGEEYDYHHYFPMWTSGTRDDGTYGYKLALSIESFIPLSSNVIDIKEYEDKDEMI